MDPVIKRKVFDLVQFIFNNYVSDEHKSLLVFKYSKMNDFDEIIIAVKPSIEGETTSLYIKRILEGLDIKVTRLASGIPMGADIEYIDSLTLERAINDRKEIE